MFSAERQNLDYLKIQQGAFMALGLDIGVTRRKNLLKSIWRFLFNNICTLYMQYGFMNFAIHSITNIDSITGSLSMFNQGVLLLFKLFLIILKGDSMLKLIWEMNILTKDGKLVKLICYGLRIS